MATWNSVDTETQVTVADSEYHALDPRSIQVQRIAGWIFTAIVGAVSLGGVGIALLAADDMPAWLRGLLPFLWLAATILLAWHAHRWPVLRLPAHLLSRGRAGHRDSQGRLLARGDPRPALARAAHRCLAGAGRAALRPGHARHLHRRHRPRQSRPRRPGTRGSPAPSRSPSTLRRHRCRLSGGCTRPPCCSTL